jgi:glutamate/tyrosine decarboxylase-like PLP-dependent enzyme
LERADSLQINFSKMMMTGIGGSLFYVKDKQYLSEAMGSKIEFSIL